MKSFTVKLWYNKQRVKKSKKVSLYLQVCYRREAMEIPLKLEWPEKNFDWKKRELRPRFKDDPDIADFNVIIENKRSVFWNAAKHFMLQNRDFTLDDIMMHTNLFGELEGFADYMKQTINRRQRNKKIKEETAKAHLVSYQWLKKYRPKDVAISEINAEWIEEYEAWLITKMHPNTVWCRIKDLKAYLNIAYKKDQLPVNLDYQRFENPKAESNPTWLDQEELKSLITLYRELKNTSDKRDLRAFLFACFTGLRISDLKRFTKEWIQGDEFVFEPKKQLLTKTRKKTLRIPIIPIAREFINSMQTDRLVETTDVKLNQKLKKFASMANIKKNLTTHVARHTFATQLAVSGVPVSVIMNLMGHSKIEVTMIYVHIAENVKAREMMKLQYEFGNSTVTAAVQT